MKNEKAIKLISKIDDKYVDEALSYGQDGNNEPGIEKKTGHRRVMNFRWVAAAAAVILVVAAFSVARNISAEAKEYAAAVEYFKTNGMSTEGLSRTEIKETYRRIITTKEEILARSTKGTWAGVEVYKLSREDYILLLKADKEIAAYANYVRKRFNPDYDPYDVEIAPSGEYIYVPEPDRDVLYAKFFKGEYVTDPDVAIDNIPYSSFEDLLFNINIGIIYLGQDSSVVEYNEPRHSDIGFLMRFCPTEVMRERPDGTRYLIYDTDENCRVFFMMSPDRPQAFTVGYPILYKNKLCYADFKDIKPGDTLTTVSQVDDACEIYRRVWFEAYKFDKLGFENNDPMRHSTIHYLTDGLLEIQYDKLNEDGDPVVKAVNYYPDYKMETYTFKLLDYRINPLDLPESK
jgi:hypothetical protein